MSDRTIAVGSVHGEPGNTAQGYVTVGEWQDAQPARVPVAVVNGGKPGPILYLQAASDGDELNGVEVIRRVLKAVPPRKLRGGLIAAPLVNVHAFHAHRSHSPVDNTKMNRCFPGRKNGTSSERMAFFLFENAVRQANYCIDLHQGGVGRMVDECRVRVALSERAGKESFELARVFGIGYIFHKKGPKGQLARAAPAKGIPTIDPELGGCHGWEESSIRKGVQGVMNVLRHYGLLDGKPRVPERQTVVHDLKRVLSSRGGFLTYRRRLHDLVERDDVLAEISDPFGNVVTEIRSPAKGVFWSQNVYPMVASGQSIGQIGTGVKYV